MNRASRSVAGFCVVLGLATAPSVFPQAMRNVEGNRVQDALPNVTEDTREASRIEADKDAFVAALVSRWAGEATLRGSNAFVEKATRKMLRLSGERLLALSREANTFEALKTALTPNTGVNVFGDLSRDLVFNPLPGCRLLDTRVGTGPYAGPLAPNVSMSFSVNDALGPQGGNAAGCGVSGDLDDPPALAIVITAVPTNASPGNLRTYATGGTIPVAATLTYVGGTVTSTGATTASDATNLVSDELTVRNQGAGTTHVVVDVVGYFHVPNQTPLTCTTLSTSQDHAGFFFLFSPACPAGTTLTGGGHDWGSGTTDVWFWQSGPNTAGSATSWLCRGNVNRGGESSTITCFGVCCNLPGR